jgi:choline dehydrogenase-like flavoprotein
MTTPPADPSEFPAGPLRADVVVLGSGPGGAITACLLAEAGRNVMLLEEGPSLTQDSCPPFSMAEMTGKYRHGGVTAAMGKPPVAYVEARCVGGGSEINSGLYHRTPPEVLEEWRREYRVEELRDEDLVPHFEANERELGVGIHPGGASPASLRLQSGAQALGWKCQEVPRWFGAENPGAPPVRRSMTRTFVPRLLQAGGRLLPGVRVLRIARSGKGWAVSACSSEARSRSLRIDAGSVFVACGAVQTPSLLLRSGFGGPIGRTLGFHPTVKVVATFPEPVNQSGMGVGVHQVKEFAPSMTLGCSVSSPPYLALALAEAPEALRGLGERWPTMAVYYAMIRGGRGSVRRLPFFEDPWVRQQLSPGDLEGLSAALKHLCDCLLAAGATSLVTPVSSEPGAPLQSLAEVLKRRGSLMTVHLFSSCPMGEDSSRCPVDSFGRVRGADNLFVADASLLCSAPGVNPQGTLMALARRNALRFLGRP